MPLLELTRRKSGSKIDPLNHYIVIWLSSPHPLNSDAMSTMKPIKICLIASAVVALISLVLYIPIWFDDVESRRNRARVHELISIGQDIQDAQSKLKAAGFQLNYDEPKDITGTGTSFSQLVIVGETQPNRFESFGYAAAMRWMPFTHAESAYVIIRSDLSGKITQIR